MNTIEMLANAMDKIIDEKVNEKMKSKEITFEDVQNWAMANHENFKDLLKFLADNARFDETLKDMGYLNMDCFDKDIILNLVSDNNLEESIAETYMNDMNYSEKAQKVKDWIDELI